MGGTIIQIKDFLCGCDYCKTVPTGQPLDIASHMMLCDSQRQGMLKTIEVMNSMKKPKLEDKNLTKIEENKQKPKTSRETSSDYQKHKWTQDNEGTWIFSNEEQLLNKDGWMYREDIGWLWSFNKKTFLYSEIYGWLYNYHFNKYKIYYWYDKRGWFRPKKLSQYF